MCSIYLVLFWQVAEKCVRDSQVEGAAQCGMIDTLLQMHNDCNVLRTKIGPGKMQPDYLPLNPKP